MNLKRLGNLMSHWHGSINDPIYAVGSYFRDGRPHPDVAVVYAALKGVENLQRTAHVGGRRELREIWHTLFDYLTTAETGRVLLRSAVLRGVTGAIWCSPWADWADAHKIPLSGCDVCVVAPTPPKAVDYVVADWERAFVRLNGFDLEEAYRRARSADGLNAAEEDDDYAELLGHYLVTEGFGHGVGWRDDHQAFALKLPNLEATVYTNTKHCRNPKDCHCRLMYECHIGGAYEWKPREAPCG